MKYLSFWLHQVDGSLSLFFYRYCYWLKVINSRVISFFFIHIYVAFPFPHRFCSWTKQTFSGRRSYTRTDTWDFTYLVIKVRVFWFNIKTAPMFANLRNCHIPVPAQLSLTCVRLHFPAGWFTVRWVIRIPSGQRLSPYSHTVPCLSFPLSRSWSYIYQTHSQHEKQTPVMFYLCVKQKNTHTDSHRLAFMDI